MEIKPVSEPIDPKYKNIHIQTGIREYNAERSELTSWGLGGLTREQPAPNEMLDHDDVDKI